MYKTCFINCLEIILLIFVSTAYAGVGVFSDDFSYYDDTLWDKDVTDVPECSAEIVNGELKTTFEGANASQHAYAVSKSIPLPTNWSSISISGKWYAGQYQTGEHEIKVFDAQDSTCFVRTAYVNWPSIHFRATDANGLDQEISRSMPTSYRDFELNITPQGWRFVEDSNEIINTTNTPFSDVNDIKIRLGGWDYSPNTGTMFFDDINVTIAQPYAVNCPNDAIFCQLPFPPDLQWASFPYSDQAEYKPYYERYENITQEVSTITWWGLNYKYDNQGNPIPCQRNSSYEYYTVCFSPENGGSPDYCQNLYENRYVVKKYTGVDYYMSDDFFPLYEYSMSIDWLTVPDPGYLSIQNPGNSDCFFVWMGSDQGDGTFRFYDPDNYIHPWQTYSGSDLAMCLRARQDAPCNPWPCDGAQFSPLSLELSVEHEPQVQDYYLYLGKNPPDSESTFNYYMNQPSCLVGPLDTAQTYYWKIKAKDGRDIAYSDTYSFKTRGNYIGDLNYSETVDGNDLAIFVNQWMRSDCNDCNDFCHGADINYQGDVNLKDFALFAPNWQKPWPPENNYCQNATAIPAEGVEYYVAGTTIEATGSDITSCGVDDKKDVWFSFTASETKEYVIIAQIGFSKSATMAIYPQCNGEEYSCTENGTGGYSPDYCVKSMNLDAGETIIIRIAFENNEESELFSVYVVDPSFLE